MSPDLSMKVAWIGSLTPRRLHLVNHHRKPFLPPRPPFWCRLQELLPSPQVSWGHEEGEGGRLRAQPIEIWHPATQTSQPRLRSQPMKIQLAGLPAERPGPGQRPMISLEMRVPQWSIPTASPHLLCHSFPSQRPSRIQEAHLARTTLKSGSFISRPKLTPDRIWLPPVLERTSPDLASPHLLYSNPLPSPSLDRLLGTQWLIPIERQGKLKERGLGLSTHCCPDTRLQIDAALPEAAALDRRAQPPTVLDIAEPRLTEEYQPQGPRLHRRKSRKRRRNRSTMVYKPSKRSPPRGHWCE